MIDCGWTQLWWYHYGTGDRWKTVLALTLSNTFLRVAMMDSKDGGGALVLFVQECLLKVVWTRAGCCSIDRTRLWRGFDDGKVAVAGMGACH